MSQEQRPAITLVDQQQALDAYLDSLLAEATEAAPTVEAQPKPARVVSLSQVETAVPAAAPEAPSEVPEAAESLPPEPEPETPLQPEWGRSRFQCLIFRVHGLKLAVPLARLNGIRVWNEEELTSMPGHAPHFVGLVQGLEHTVRVIDTAQLVMPADRRPPPLGSEDRRRPSHLLLVGERRWGLLCDALADTLTLEPDEVHWRTRRGRRPWLAGTVIEHMCALLDVDAFVEILERDPSVPDA